MVRRYLRRKVPGCPKQDVVAECETLEEGLERLDAGDMDVVLLDMNLPDSDGLDTVAAVIARAPKVAVVVITGLDEDRMGMASVDLGAQDFVSKHQLHPTVLGRVIEYAVRRQRALNDARCRSAAWSRAIQAVCRTASVCALEQRRPAVFGGMVDLYRAVVEATESDAQSTVREATLRELVRRLVGASVASSDVLDIHVAASQWRPTSGSEPNRNPEHQQLLLFEVLGRLVTAYSDKGMAQAAQPTRRAVRHPSRSF